MRNNLFFNETNKLEEIEAEYNQIFKIDDFLDYDEVYNITDKILPNKINIKLKYILHIFSYLTYKNKYKKLSNYIKNTKEKIDKHNNIIYENEKTNFLKICKQVENKELDDQQINAIIRKNRNQLIISGAGSGKTTTIVGKVKYLLLTNQYKPEDILLLSFTNASATEMKERIKSETNINLDVMTFHKLGLEIIKKSYEQNYKIFDKDLQNAIKDIINSCTKQPEYLNKLIYFMSTVRFNTKDEFDFSSEKEYKDYLNTNKPTTLNNEIVKSYGELEIANFLFKNNIKYIYEEKYKYETINSNYQQYYPDFYLPEYDIYIEYFGIDENNKVAPYFKDKNGLSASDSYNKSIEWKRNTHKSNNTTLIETFYYENKQGNLIRNLKNNLEKHNVKINPKSSEELLEIINQKNKGLFNQVCNVFATIINLIKSNNYSISYIQNLPEVTSSSINKLTLELIIPIYKAYQDFLNNGNMIDFNDMINMAIEAILNNKFKHNYKYVIVDEYQDMSIARYKLLKALRDQQDYKLFCVGDDWQSIYRFNGSDIDLITSFEKYWGNTYQSVIEKTYRFTSMISILSGKFIMKNHKQYKKDIKAETSNDFALKFLNGYTEKNSINFLENELNKFKNNSTVYFLGRYSSDINMFKYNNNFIMNFNIQENSVNITYLKRKDLKIKFLTIHKSKGLQADYVVILNNKKYGMGFPSKIDDLPLIKILLTNGLDDYPYSEERRLFYVALTRSKKQTLLLTIKDNKSAFIDELEASYNYLMKTDSKLAKSIYTCPKCGGKLILRTGQYSKFLGCSNYPDCKYIRK